MTVNVSDMGTDVAVCIPWRPGPGREEAFERVSRWYAQRGYTVYTSDSDDRQPFNLAQARNMAVDRAWNAKAIVVADADTIPDEKALRSAARRAISQYRVFYPFTEYLFLPHEAIAEPNLPLVKPIRDYKESVGGVVVLNRQTYLTLNGFDENFRQWGYEDNAFMLAAEALIGVERLPGTIYAFDHEAERDMTSDNPGKARVKLYQFARSDKTVMQELIRTNRASRT